MQGRARVTGARRTLPAAGVTLLDIGQEGILFDRIGQRLFHLNRTATFLWRRLEEGDRPTAGSPARSGAIPWTGDAEQMVEAWRRLGLLRGSGERRAPYRRRTGPSAPRVVTSSKPPMAPLRRCYRLLESEFSLGFPSETLENLVHSAIGHLESIGTERGMLRLDIVQAEGLLRLQRQRETLASCANVDRMVPLIQGSMGLLATRRYPYLMALHAAGLSAGGGVLLLPGRSGSGKSVLAAALVAAGWGYLSDDAILLTKPRLDSIGVPYSIGVKKGGWQLVRRHCPALPVTGTHWRQDDRPVRYLLPPRDGLVVLPQPVRWIGFPRRSGSGGGNMRRLEQIDGVRRLLEHCCAVPRPLTIKDVRQLIRWSSGIRFFDFAVGDIDVAVARLGDLPAGRDGNRPVDLTLSEVFLQQRNGTIG